MLNFFISDGTEFSWKTYAREYNLAEEVYCCEILFICQTARNIEDLPCRRIIFFVYYCLQSLDYDTCENKLVVDEERTRGYPYVIQTDVARWFLFFLIGLFTAAIGVFVDVSIAYLADLKYSILKQCILFINDIKQPTIFVVLNYCYNFKS